MIDFNAFINNRRLFISSINNNLLIINGKNIQFPNRVYGVAVNDTIVAVLLKEVGINGSIRGDNQPLNNIYVYDHNGEFLWNIADIVGDVSLPYTGVSAHSKETLVEAWSLSFDEKKAIAGHDFLVCRDWGGIRYIIDVTQKKLIDRRGFKD